MNECLLPLFSSSPSPSGRLAAEQAGSHKGKELVRSATAGVVAPGSAQNMPASSNNDFILL